MRLSVRTRRLAAGLLLGVLTVSCRPAATTPAATQPATSQPAASAAQEGIEAAILAHAQLADLASAPYTVVVEAEAEGYARATLQPKDPATTEAAIVYLKQESDRWVVLVVGSAFEPGLLDSLGVPRGIRHGDS